jgi:hypothetical protein
VVKGTVLSSIPECIVERFGKKRLNQCLTALTEKAKRVFEGTIPVVSWYPIKEVMVESTNKLSPPGFRKIDPDL